MHGLPGLPRWDDLRIFLAILRAGSFSAAARQLAIEQSTVSRRIAALEDSLGGVLFERLPEGPRATALAELLRSRAELIEAQVLELADLGRGESSTVAGSVRLASTDSFAVQVLLPQVLSTLFSRHPGLRLALVGGDHSVDLPRREADLALRFFRPAGGDLVAKRVARLPLAVLGHKAYVKGKRRVPGAFDWVTTSMLGVPTFENQYLARELHIEARLTVSSHLLQVEAVRAGLGVALLTRALRKLYGELVELELGLPAIPPVELWLVAPRMARGLPRVAAVWSLLEEQLAALDDA